MIRPSVRAGFRGHLVAFVAALGAACAGAPEPVAANTSNTTTSASAGPPAPSVASAAPSATTSASEAASVALLVAAASATPSAAPTVLQSSTPSGVLDVGDAGAGIVGVPSDGPLMPKPKWDPPPPVHKEPWVKIQTEASENDARIVRIRGPWFNKCLREAAKLDPGLNGVAKIGVAIATDGSAKVKTSSGELPAQLMKCFEKAAEAMKFEARTQPSSIVVRLTASPPDK